MMPEKKIQNQEPLKEAVQAKVYDPYVDYSGGQWEFGGPIGVSLMMVGFPIFMYYMFISYAFYDCQFARPMNGESLLDFLTKCGGYIMKKAFPTVLAWKIEWGFFTFQALCYIMLPGRWAKGLPIPQRNGEGLDFYCNAVASLYFSTAVALFLHFLGIFRLYTIIDHFGEIMSVAIISGFLVALIVYIRAVVDGSAARMRNIFVYDFFMGAPLSPRIGILDLKMFFEVRLPWFTLYFLSLATMLKQYETYGYVSYQAMLGFLGTWLFANACAKGEELIVSSWDIFYEKFGFMLAFWNMAGVPFTYCYNTLYMASHDPSLYRLPVYANVLLTITMLLAYYFFDTANGQKNAFRQMIAGTFVPRKTFPQLPYQTIKNPQYIKCSNGGTLLVDGWCK